MPHTETEIVQRFYETVFGAGDIDAAGHYMAEDFVDHAPWPGHPPTCAGFQAGVKEMRAAFPDLAIRPVRVFAEEDKVAAVVRISGTQHGEFMGHRATGRAFEIDAVDILRVRDGKLAEHWGVIDSGQMLAQLRLSLTA
jgi:steroid delta-isomerase-like uncharacterized protein